MGFDNLFHYLNLTLEVFFLDLLLSGDNALVIALACRSLPPALTKRAMLIGIDGAIALRILLTTVASLLLHIPLLKLVGGVALTVIAINLTIEEEGNTESDKSPPKNPPDLWSAVGTIILADLVMSVDNVVALAAVTQGNIFFLTMGLLMSVPLLMFGSLFVTALLRRYPLLKRGGGAMLGWIAGDIAISDPMITGWVNQQSPALTIVVPILVVVFVLIESRIMEGAQATAYALRPKLRPKAVIINSPPAVIEPAPAEVIITVASQSVEADAPSPISAAKTLETPRQPEPGTTLPRDADTTSHVQAPRDKRFRLSVWIAVAISVALLWILFRFLSLDFATTTPAIQFTSPTRPR
ncbi:MAG: TerC family protein [Steroidobacteraceae bacterium]|jgi:YjbE family integral membrane protein